MVGALPAGERRALLMRDVEGASWHAIAQALQADPGPLLVAARLTVREGVRGRPAPREVTPDCAGVRVTLAALVDREPVEATERIAAREHVADCDECREVRLGLREAVIAMGAWAPDEPARPPAADGDPRRAARVLPPVAPAAPAASGPLPAAEHVAAGASPASDAASPAGGPARRPRRAAVLVLAAVVLTGAAAIALTGRDGPPRPSAPAAVDRAPADPAPATAPSRKARARKARAAAEAERRRRARRRKARAAATATPAPAVPTATPAPAATPLATPPPSRQQQPRRPRRDRPAQRPPRARPREEAPPAPTPQGQNAPPGLNEPVGSDPCSEDSPDCESG